ncbi:MAG: hypothetical protein HFG66_15415 [Hungatella sp.]|nr:hypothetical protein [Hungatella sp.]
MPEYFYRPELKAKVPAYSIDFSKPALAPMIKAMVRSLRQASASYLPPEGIRCRTVCAKSWDGQAVTCFVVEPETEGLLPGMLYCHGGGFLNAKNAFRYVVRSAQQVPLTLSAPQSAAELLK